MRAGLVGSGHEIWPLGTLGDEGFHRALRGQQLARLAGDGNPPDRFGERPRQAERRLEGSPRGEGPAERIG